MTCKYESIYRTIDVYLAIKTDSSSYYFIITNRYKTAHRTSQDYIDKRAYNDVTIVTE